MAAATLTSLPCLFVHVLYAVTAGTVPAIGRPACQYLLIMPGSRPDYTQPPISTFKVL